MRWAVTVWAFGTPDVDLEVLAGNVAEAGVVARRQLAVEWGVALYRVKSTYPRQLEAGPQTDAFAGAR